MSAWCACGDKILPAGVLSIWMDGWLHAPEGCEEEL